MSNIWSLTHRVGQCYKLAVSSIERIPSELRGHASLAVKGHFYVIFIPRSNLSVCLDTIRFLCEPTAKWRSHITVRGPYWREIDTAPFDELLQGNLITISGVNRFQSEYQQTVYFQCLGTSLARVWDKKDFGYNPHLTIYDGGSVNIADHIAAVVSRYTYNVSFRADRLCLLTDPLDRLNFGHIWKSNSEFLRRVLGESVELKDFLYGDLSHRLGLAQRLCEFLSAASDLQTTGPSAYQDR
jgi:hypothetical protein